MSTELEIRPYRPEDALRLLTIWRTASEIGHPFFTQTQLDEQQQLVGDVYLPKAETWVALSKANPVGFIGLLGNFIGGLFVAPENHGAGVGKSLIEHALKIHGTLELDVYALNEGALGFYRRLGFVEIFRRPCDDNGLAFEVIKLRR